MTTVTEEVGLHDHCPPGLDHQSTRDTLNGLLGAALGGAFISPYVAVEKMGKVLANYGIVLPRVYFLHGTSGSHVFDVNQFGMVSGMNNKGEVVTKQPRFSLVFSYESNDLGMYTAKARLVDHSSESSLYEQENYDPKGTITPKQSIRYRKERRENKTARELAKKAVAAKVEIKPEEPKSTEAPKQAKEKPKKKKLVPVKIEHHLTRITGAKSKEERNGHVEKARAWVNAQHVSGKMSEESAIRHHEMITKAAKLGNKPIKASKIGNIGKAAVRAFKATKDWAGDNIEQIRVNRSDRKASVKNSKQKYGVALSQRFPIKEEEQLNELTGVGKLDSFAGKITNARGRLVKRMSKKLDADQNEVEEILTQNRKSAFAPLSVDHKALIKKYARNNSIYSRAKYPQLYKKRK